MVLLWSMWIPLQAEASSNPPVVSRTLKVKQTLTLTYQNKSVKWSTSDKTVAKISKTFGKQTKVTALKKGTANIKAKLNGKVVAICKITVKKSGTATTNSNSSNNNSNKNNNNSNTVNPVTAINNYFKSNSQYTKISDGNGSFDKLNGHAGTQRASYMRSGVLMSASSLDGKYQYFTYQNNKYTGIGWRNAITLSFNNTTFQTGENCGVLRVLNCSVPNASYTWSSSNSSVVGIQVMTPDISAVRILAKNPGSAVITCKVSFPNGESTVLKSTVNVSNTVGNNIKNGTVDMNRVMEKVRAAYIAKDCKWIPDHMSTQKAAEIGYTALGSYSSYEILYDDIEDDTRENVFRPMKYLGNPEGYVIAYATETFSDVYYYVEYQGYNTNGIQLAQVGVLSIP